MKASAIFTSVLLTMVRYLRHGSRLRREVGDRSKSRPIVEGLQKFCFAPHVVQPAAPCDISIAIRRVASSARTASAPPKPAGIMESSSGRATVAPMPFRKMRRGMCLPVISLIVFLPRYCDVSFAFGEATLLSVSVSRDPGWPSAELVSRDRDRGYLLCASSTTTSGTWL